MTEEIKVNFLQVIGSQKDRLFEFFALKFLDDLGFWPLRNIRSEKLGSLPPGLTISKFGNRNRTSSDVGRIYNSRYVKPLTRLGESLDFSHTVSDVSFERLGRSVDPPEADFAVCPKESVFSNCRVGLSDDGTESNGNDASNKFGSRDRFGLEVRESRFCCKQVGGNLCS